MPVKTPRQIEEMYFPLLKPHPNRIRKWQRKISYGGVKTIGPGPVSGSSYSIEAPVPAVRGKRIAFLVDLHYGDTAQDRALAAAALSTVKEFRPDYLCFGGDMVADSNELDAVAALLERFSECAPVRLAVPGNWERGKAWLPVGFWKEFYAASGFRYLCNNAFEDDLFSFYGSDELPYGTPLLPDNSPADKVNVLLVHRPDTVIGLDTMHKLLPFRLILCGHTHGGQVRFPLVGPIYTRSSYGCRFAYGLFQRRNQNTEMIVSSGISSKSFPFRLNCRREVVLVTFH